MLTVCPSSLKLNVSPFVSSLGACSDHSGSSVVVSSGVVSSVVSSVLSSSLVSSSLVSSSVLASALLCGVLSCVEDSSCDDVGVTLSLGVWEDVSGTLSDELSVGICKDVSGILSVAKASDVRFPNIVCSSIVCVCVSCLIFSVVSSANEYCGM